MASVLFLQPPSPPRMEVARDYAGGFGVADHAERDCYGHGKFSLPYVSLMYSAGLIAKQHHDIIYVDAQAERLNAEATISRICSFRPDVVVAVVNLPSIYADGHFLRRLRSQCPDSKLICIGPVCRVLPDVVAEMSMADVIVLGETESVLPDLVRSITEGISIEKVRGIGTVQDGHFFRTPPSTELVGLEELPWPPHDIMPINRYHDPFFGTKLSFFPIWASRGCSMPCSFYCPYPLGLGRTIRLRPSDDVVNEIAHLNKKHKIRAFMFRDQVFSSKLDRAEEICDLLIDRRLKIQWDCETRFDMVSKKLLTRMSKAGCRRIDFGLETGDPVLLHKIGKPGMKMLTVKRAVRLTKEAGIIPMTHLILGLPGESRSTVQRTFATLRELGIANISVNLATPYPGTRLFRYAKEHGLLVTEDWSRYTSFNAVMRSEFMSPSELEESRAFIKENLLGATLLDKITYLCRNKEIIDAIRSKLVIGLREPSTLLHLLPGLFHREHRGMEK